MIIMDRKLIPRFGAVAVGIGLFLGVTYVALTFMNSTPSYGSNTPLSPARGLAGTWKTSFPVKFYIATDFDTGTLQDVGSEDRQVTWIITSTGDPNVYDIEQNFSESNRQLTGGGYVPDVSPYFYTGTVSSSSLTVMGGDRVVGEFAFTSNVITGTWNDEWTMAYAQRVYTDVNTLTLTKQ
jgi:hypothetical protein